MKAYKLKKLPISGAANFADLGQLQKRLEHLEAIINSLGIKFGGDAAPDPELYEEITVEELTGISDADQQNCTDGGCGCSGR